jgi:hypothetical protein
MKKKIEKSRPLRKKYRSSIDPGIDIFSLKANLDRSIIERIRRHQIALNTVEKLRKAKFL